MQGRIKLPLCIASGRFRDVAKHHCRRESMGASCPPFSGREAMTTRLVSTIGLAALLIVTGAHAQKIRPDSIGGTVTGPNGPEAGVWVIAETAGLPTGFAKLGGDGDQGRFVLPPPPKGGYGGRGRGYGGSGS